MNCHNMLTLSQPDPHQLIDVIELNTNIRLNKDIKKIKKMTLNTLHLTNYT